MITCPACSKQNQDHYRFCLGCGAELPRGGGPIVERDDSKPGVGGAVPHIRSDAPHAAAKPVSAPPPAAVRPSAKPAAPEATPGLPPGMCPECEYVNPTTNRFCASCGFRLDDAAKAAPKKAAPVAETGDEVAILIALDPEGNEVGRHRLVSGENRIGRQTGGIFGNDAFLSPVHAVFEAEGGRVTVRDADSLNGVFKKLLAEQRAPLNPGQRFRIGQELLQFDALEPNPPDGHGVSQQGGAIEGYVGRVSLVVGRETVRPSYPMSERGINLGRERGDILFPEDGYVSGLHCHISFEDGDVFVTDLGSSNGTFVQLTEEVELHNGDVLLMGQQLFRIAI